MSYTSDLLKAAEKYGVTVKRAGGNQNMADILPAPQQTTTPEISNDMDTWVRSLPAGLDDTALNTYIYSNSNFKNNNARQSAYDWYHEIYGTGAAETPATSLPPLADSIGGMSGGMNEGQVRQALKGLGYESSDISDGWKLYNDKYGYDIKKASPYAQNLAGTFPNITKHPELLDAWLSRVEQMKDLGYLTKNDLNWLLAMAEGWGSYYD